jgi:hypothetical protein
MKILTNPAPYVPSPSAVARSDIRLELRRLASIPDLMGQDSACRGNAVEFGGTTVYFSKGISVNSPLFVQHTTQGVKRVHILSPDRNIVGVFDNRGRDAWERRALLRSASEILTSLPKRAFVTDTLPVQASEKQMAVVRKILEVPAEEALPVISSRAAGRLIDRITVEKAAAELAEDLIRWESETTVPIGEMTAA